MTTTPQNTTPQNTTPQNTTPQNTTPQNTSTASQTVRRARTVLVASAISVGSVLLLGAGPASAQCAYPEVCVQPVTIEPSTNVSPQVPTAQPQVQPAVQQPTQQPAQLPVTGSDVGVIAAGGLLMVGAGVVLTRRSTASTN